MMQLESQVLVREFNRRLRSALTHAPNHVRVEAALEVESHVLDVLSRRPSEELPEREQVAAILAGFGSPEEYASALTSQIGFVQAATVRSGLREVVLAVGDLIRGTGRLMAATVIQAAVLLSRGARFSHMLVARAICALRPWLARAAITASQAGVRVRRAARIGRAGTDRAARWAGGWVHFMMRKSHQAFGLAAQGGRLLTRLAKSVLRVALVAGACVIAVAAFALAAFAALAPDIVGWFTLGIQYQVGQYLDALRAETLARYALSDQAGYQSAGEMVMVSALVVGTAMVVGLAYLAWNSRRRLNTL